MPTCTDGPSAQRVSTPARHGPQSPQPRIADTPTRSPTATSAPCGADTTTPQASWPALPAMPAATAPRSLPHSALHSTRTSASPAPATGTGASTSSTRPSPRSRSARISEGGASGSTIARTTSSAARVDDDLDGRVARLRQGQEGVLRLVHAHAAVDQPGDGRSRRGDQLDGAREVGLVVAEAAQQPLLRHHQLVQAQLDARRTQA